MFESTGTNCPSFFFNPDVILIEGHKKAEFEKAVILRDDADLPIIEELVNLKLILCRDLQLSYMLSEKQNIPVFLCKMTAV